MPGAMPGTLYSTTTPPWHKAGKPTRAWHLASEGSGGIRTAGSDAAVCVATSSSHHLLGQKGS